MDMVLKLISKFNNFKSLDENDAFIRNFEKFVEKVQDNDFRWIEAIKLLTSII